MLSLAWDDGSYFLAREPEGGRFAPDDARISAKGEAVLTRRRHGSSARIEVHDACEVELPVAARLRAAAAAGQELARLGPALERPLRVRLRSCGPDALELDPDGVERLDLDGPELARAPIHHPVHARARALLAAVPWHNATLPRANLPETAARRVLFFESLMNSDMPHNDRELSQGVLHMASSLADTTSQPVLANVKMSITGSQRPVLGLEQLGRALEAGPVDLVCITLLEGYWEGVVALIAELRRLGCRAHVAVGGVMPTLTPEHVAAHLPDVSFVCRGAGEYFVPRLARILGADSTIDRAFSDEQRAALLGMDGLIALDRAGRRLISANSARSVRVESLDSVVLDLRLLERRHLEQGVELSTSRGCIHKCSFCSIIGRQSYQSRSADGVFQTLERYQQRYRELFGDDVPVSAYRLHVSDDDFACDKPRARAFFERILHTPFRLASLQVSVADLCLRGERGLLPRPDPEILDAIKPECFADSAAVVPEHDYVADHHSRSWSSYLQIGVETFSDRELDRLGKGYAVEHVRAIVDELAQRRIHLDAYFILANADTSAADLVDSVEELCRLKLRHPKWFHVRFPIVPRLVSYFPSASYRRMLRNGRSDALRLRHVASVPSHPELDYPFVDADEPADTWVRAVDASFFTDRGFYTETLTALRRRFLELWGGEHERTPERERLLRRLDDAPRQLVFEMLREASPASEEQAVATALAVLGPKHAWLPAFKRYVSAAPGQLVVFPNGQRVRGSMSAHTLERAIALLLSSRRPALTLELDAGESPEAFTLLQHGLEHAVAASTALGRQLKLVVRHRACLDDEQLRRLSAFPVTVDLSVRPDDAARVRERFFDLANLGFVRIRLSVVRDATWSMEQQRALADGLHQLGEGLRARWSRGENLDLLDLEAGQPDVVGVDWDGRIYGNDFPIGHLDDLCSFDRHWLDAAGGESAHRPVARVLSSFVRWMGES